MRVRRYSAMQRKRADINSMLSDLTPQMSPTLTIEGFGGGKGVWLLPHNNQHINYAIVILSELIATEMNNSDTQYSFPYTSVLSFLGYLCVRALSAYLT